METILPVNAHERIDEFKEQFWKRVTEKSKQIALTTTKILADEFVQKQKIEKYDSVLSIEQSLSKIVEYNVKETYVRNFTKITEIINKKDYNQLLVICNLKKKYPRN